MTSLLTRRALGCAICAAVTLASASPAAAASKAITGKLSKRGYSVVALSKGGLAASAAAKQGAFSLTAPAASVTLQLRDATGRYAGPVVVGRKGSRVVLGIRQGAKLGAIVIHRGYATPKHKLAKRFVNTKVTARASKGVPAGSQTFGLEKRRARMAQAGPPPPGGGPPPPPGGQTPPPGGGQGGADPDGDGVPSAFDVDDNGNGVLDNVDPSTAPAASFGMFTSLFLGIEKTVNANAANVTDEQIDAAMVANVRLTFTAIADDTELDCGGLSYCSAGGTGVKFVPAEEGGGSDPFPACCDADANGFGTISGGRTGPTGQEFALSPHAKAADIGSGDAMIERVGTGAALKETPGTVNFVFSTIPAIKQWADGAGGGATVAYPVAANGAGTQMNPLVLGKDPSGDYTLTLTVWRPQRKAIPGAGEGSGFVDIGRLGYDFNIPNIIAHPPGQAGFSPQCPGASLSTTDPNMKVGGEAIGRIQDNASDAAASPENTMSFTVNLSKCASLKGGALNPGTTLNVDLGANSTNSRSVDHANQVFYIKTT